MEFSRRPRQSWRRADARRRRVDLRGAPGARRPLQLSAKGRDAVTFIGCILSEPPPGGYPDHFWLITPKGTRELVAPSARPLIETLTGLHDPVELGDRLVQMGHSPDGVRRLLGSRWFLSLPGTLTPIDFTSIFGGHTLTRAPSEVARRDPSVPDILMRTDRSTTPVEVPGWLYSHLVGPHLRPDLVETVAWRIDDPELIVERIETVIGLLPRLLGDGIASLTAAGTSAAARLVDEQAYGPNVQRLGPARDEGLDWLIRFLSKV